MINFISRADSRTDYNAVPLLLRKSCRRQINLRYAALTAVFLLLSGAEGGESHVTEDDIAGGAVTVLPGE